VSSTKQCPRPDKLAFDTEEAARQRYISILHTDPSFGLYLCDCGKWHGGNHVRNEKRHESTMRAVPSIRTGLNPMPAPEQQPRRRYQTERHYPSKVESTTVNPKLWKQALRMVGGDKKRLQILGPDSVMIHNNADWRRKSA
jgi:hypothetical protein